jgi:hypothetical protein
MRESVELRRLASVKAPGIAAIGMLLAAGALAAAAPACADPPGIDEQLARALAYEHGEGLPKDQRVAAAIYCDAARAGSAEATYRLGWMYANGRGVMHDDATAAALFRLAAEHGHAYAQRMLARMSDAPALLPDCMRPPEPLVVLADTGGDSLEIDDLGPDPFDDLPPVKRKIAELVNRVAPKYGIEPRLALAVIAVESNFDATARSARNARGLMQLIPQTAARFNVRNPFDIMDNVRGGLAYLRWLLAYYRGQVRLAAAAYNSGEGAVDYYRGVPPYPETREYVRRVLRLFPSDRHPYDPRVVDPSATVSLQLSGRN